MKKLNTYELIGVCVRWCLDIDTLSVKDYKAFLQNFNFISVHAMHDHFKDSAHIKYDYVVCRLAGFVQENNGLSVVHYEAQNMHQKVGKSTYNSISGKKPFEYTKDGKKPCFKWNREFRCSRSEEECGYGCAKCGSHIHYIIYKYSHNTLYCRYIFECQIYTYIIVCINIHIM